MMGDSHTAEDFTGPDESLRLEASGLQNHTWATAHSLLCHLYLPATALAGQDTGQAGPWKGEA